MKGILSCTADLENKVMILKKNFVQTLFLSSLELVTLKSSSEDYLVMFSLRLLSINQSGTCPSLKRQSLKYRCHQSFIIILRTNLIALWSLKVGLNLETCNWHIRSVTLSIISFCKMILTLRVTLNGSISASRTLRRTSK